MEAASNISFPGRQQQFRDTELEIHESNGKLWRETVVFTFIDLYSSRSSENIATSFFLVWLFSASAGPYTGFAYGRALKLTLSVGR